MKREHTDLEKSIDTFTETAVKGIDKLATMPYLREALVKEALSSFVWNIFHQMPDQRHTLAQFLENFPTAIAHERNEDLARGEDILPLVLTD